MKTKITLVEVLVLATIGIILSALIWGLTTGSSINSEAMDYLNPQYSRAVSNRKMAEEMQRANELKEEELRLQREK